jgi:hypothetical protein
MNHSLQKCFRSSLVIALLFCATAALSSCSKKPSKALIGKWQVEGQAAQVEFRKDGTLATTERGQTETGNYKFTDNTHMQMQLDIGTGNGETNHTITIACEVVMHGDMANITMTMPGDGKNRKQIANLKRIK